LLVSADDDHFAEPGHPVKREGNRCGAASSSLTRWAAADGLPRASERSSKGFSSSEGPTTRIGSFAQIVEIRKARSEHKAGKLAFGAYQARMRQEIECTVREQEKLGLDVLVHGEAEQRHDGVLW